MFASPLGRKNRKPSFPCAIWIAMRCDAHSSVGQPAAEFVTFLTLNSRMTAALALSSSEISSATESDHLLPV